jgi:hypothetical protein
MGQFKISSKKKTSSKPDEKSRWDQEQRQPLD